MALRLYYEVARRSFRRQAAYRTANLAGLVTNAVFGYLRSVIFVAAYAERGSIAGYGLEAALTFLWVTQAGLMVVQLWGWVEVEETIRSGDVVSDLARPVSYLGFWLARDLGRAAYYLLFRAAPVMLVGALLFDLRMPSSPLTWLLVLVSALLAAVVSFAWRFALNLSAFWTADARGLMVVASAFVTFLSGLVIPIPFLPSPLREVVEALPFVGLLQVPGDIFVERHDLAGAGAALLQQALWAAALLALARLVVAAATRRVVVQGG